MITIYMIIEKLDPSVITILNVMAMDSVSSVRIDTEVPAMKNVLYLHTSDNDEKVICRTYAGSSFIIKGSLINTLNQLMEIMDYYSAWENEMISASRRGCTLTELLDIAYPVINLPLIILDNNEWMIAYSYDLDKFTNQDFSDMHSFRTSDVEKIAAFNREYSYYYSKKDLYQIPGDIFTNTGYAFNLFHGDQLAGFLITDFFDMPITYGRLDMVTVLGNFIQDMINDPANGLSIGSTEMAFVHFLKYPSSDTRNDLIHELHISSWKDGDPMQIIYISPVVNIGLSPNLNHALMIFNRVFGIKAAEYAEGILLFANIRLLSENSGFESVLTKISQLYYCAGVSSIFSDISKLPLMVKRAQTALEYGDRNAASVNYFDDHYLKYFFATMPETDADILRHPLPEKLAAYDKRHGSKLFDTLFIYLKNERSIARTCSEMALARNTLIHRIERIEEMAQGILEDPEKRLQILMTYYMPNPVSG